ncbi:MAG: hypothetical protein AAGE98_00455 [Actinomycetota bacterium]
MTGELPDIDVLDVFVIDDEGRLATAEPWQRPPWTPAPAPTPPADEIDEPPTPPAASHSGDGAAAAAAPRIVRTIGEYDVFRAVVVSPKVATLRCLDGSAFVDVPGLEVDPEPTSIDGQTTTWNARIRVGWRRTRAAELLVHPSPSWVLTVVELRPRSTRSGRRRFVRVGLRVVDQIGERLVAAATTSGRAGSGSLAAVRRLRGRAG